MEFSAAVLICTKDRPEFLAETLDNILNSQLLNVKEILIADGSIGSRTKILCEELSLKSLPLNIKWVKIDGGKPSALNSGFKQLSSYEVVHCIDDDITIPKKYFVVLENFFLQNPSFVGVAPLIRNRSDSEKFLENHKNAGMITKFGNNYWFNELQRNESFKNSEWLPGGACSYRSSIFCQIKSSDSLHDSIKNYALGDDVDLSLQASKMGSLACITSLEVMHEEGPSLTSTSRNLEMDKAKAKWKIFLYRKYPEKVSLVQIIAWEYFSGIFHILKRDQLMSSPRLYNYFKTFFSEFWRTRK